MNLLSPVWVSWFKGSLTLDEIGNCAVGQGGTETSVGFAAIGVVFKNDKPIGYACAPNMIVIKK